MDPTKQEHIEIILADLGADDAAIRGMHELLVMIETARASDASGVDEHGRAITRRP